MRITLASGLAALIICLMSSGLGRAQSAGPSTPTTRILAIGTVNPGVDPAAVRAITRSTNEPAGSLSKRCVWQIAPRRILPKSAVGTSRNLAAPQKSVAIGGWRTSPDRLSARPGCKRPQTDMTTVS
jgi:hypothetical protein